jgi:cellulose synthase/poly-beta-1,6-N-acetylglucosamine synthase-like glycosyltransferase
MLPHSAAWTEAPEVYRDLGKQRARWYRGLLEVLWHHRAMMGRRRFKHIGMFALPYQLAFEALAPVLEVCGYVVFVATMALGMLSWTSALLFLAFAVGIHFCVTTLAILLCTFSERGWRLRSHAVSLSRYERARDVLALVGVGLASSFGYRQYLVYWQLRGLWDFLKGKQGWDKFARQGFAAPAVRS